MEKNKEKRPKMYNQLIRPEKKVPETDTRTVTVPMETLSLRQIKQRYANGMQPLANMEEMHFDDGKSNGVDLKTLDFNDIQRMQEETYTRVNFLTEKIKSQQAARAERMEAQVAAKKKALEAEIEAYMTKFGPKEKPGTN